MKMSEYGRSRLKGFEGEKLIAYQDSGGVWTCGVGHIEGVTPGTVITPEQSDQWFRDDIAEREQRLSRILAVYPTSQCQFDALMCLVFNIGFGDPNAKPRAIPGLLTSTVLKRHKLGNFLGAANAFTMWQFVNGKPSAGLLHRREQERLIYLGETA